MVLADLQVDAMLENHTVAELRDSFGMLLVYLVRPDGSVQFNPTGSLRLQGGDRVTVQATLAAYQELRARMGRAA